MKKCLSLDWVQMYCQCPVMIESRNGIYTVEDAGYQTRHFKKIFVVRSKKYFDEDGTGEEVAVIACQPADNSVIQKETGLVKISNKYLYQEDLLPFVQLLLKDINCAFISFSRLDVAIDFLMFDKDLEPEQFIKGFIFGKYIKKGRKTTFKIQGETLTKINKKQIAQRKFLEHQYLAFGRETSDVSYKLYNKTREMTSQKFKNWIYLHWQDNGYIGEDFVWRLEFSLKNDQKEHLIDKDGQLIDYSIFKSLETLLPKNVQTIFDYYLDRCFKFYNNEGKSRKDRNTTLKLFDNEEPGFVRIKLGASKDTGRSNKIFAKKLMQLNQELRGDDFITGVFTRDIAIHYLHRYNLVSWAKEKGLPTEHNGYIPQWKEFTEMFIKRREEHQLEMDFDEDFFRMLYNNPKTKEKMKR